MILTLQIVGGFVALLVGGEVLVRGASAVAVRLGISPLVVGVVIVGFGTSAPELVTCVRAALVGAPGIAVGNIVGSNIANILLILGIAALLRPFPVHRLAAIRDGSIVIATAIAFWLVSLTGMLPRSVGGLFVLALIVYLAFTIRHDRKNGDAASELPELATTPLGLAMVFLAAGLALIIVGAEFLVAGAVETARLFNVSEDVIGLTMVAVGTSLPELATTVIAAMKRQSAIALGNVLGSNVYNTIGIGGITALVQPIPVSPTMAHFDIPLMVLISVLLVVVVATGQRVTRLEGALLFSFYIAYVGFQALSGMNATNVS